MASIPAKAADRIRDGLKRFQPILAAAKARDVNESDTVVLVTDLLNDVFGYDKYSEITSEHMIRSTFCDLAVSIDGTLAFLLEVKAIGLELKDQHVKQAVDYAANQGVDWVGLTNGIVWRVYKVGFGKPITHEVVVEFDLAALSHRNADTVELLALLAKEGWKKARITEYHSHKEALNRFTLGALLVSESVIDVIRRELRRVTPGLKLESEQIEAALRTEVIKREVLEGDKAVAAQRQVARAANRLLRKKLEADADEQLKRGEGSADELAAVSQR
jgi:predicted type IV restriction endonuclease